MGGKTIRKRQAVLAVMGAANRDPERFPEPDRLDVQRHDNRHLAFAWAAHFCFGAPLARLEGQIAFETILHRIPNMELISPAATWRSNLSFRGLTTYATNTLDRTNTFLTESDGIMDATQLSEAKRALLEKYVRGNRRSSLRS